MTENAGEARLTVPEWFERVWIPILSTAEPNGWWEGDALNYKADGLDTTPLIRSPPFPIRFTAIGLRFGQDALVYDRTPDATSLLTDGDVAELLRKAGNPPCPHPDFLAEMRSVITAHSQLREAHEAKTKEKQFPDERIAQAVGVLLSAIPKRLEELQGEIERITAAQQAAKAARKTNVVPEDMKPVYRREIDRLEKLWAAAKEKPQLPLEKDLNGSAPTKNGLVRHLDAVFDQAYPRSKGWRKSPKTLFLDKAVQKAGWKDVTLSGIEYALQDAADQRNCLRQKLGIPPFWR